MLLSTSTFYSITREVTEVELHPNSLNRDEDLTFSRTWNSLFYTL